MLRASARSVLEATRFRDVRWFPEVDSTNRWALEQARAGVPEGLVAVADHQTAGRGRLGRTWEAPPGASLLVSILLRPDLTPDSFHLLTAAVALAASDACQRVAGVEPALKWPNDLLVGDRKLAGVLAEADVGASGGPAVVVGIGINVNWPGPLPEELEATATSLDRAAGGEVDRETLLVELLVGLEKRYAGLADQGGTGGRAPLASEYRARCSTIGRDVRVELAGESFTGTACDVNDAGQLLVSTDACIRTVSAGDVIHLRPL